VKTDALPMRMYSTAERFRKLKVAALTAKRPEEHKQLREAVATAELNTAASSFELPRWIAAIDTEEFDKEEPSKDWAASAGIMPKKISRRLDSKYNHEHEMPRAVCCRSDSKHIDEHETSPLPAVRVRGVEHSHGRVQAIRGRSVADGRAATTRFTTAEGRIAEELMARNHVLQEPRPLSCYLPAMPEKKVAASLPEGVQRTWQRPLDMEQLRGQFFRYDGCCQNTCRRILHETLVQNPVSHTFHETVV
jgi:hypothetical protein